MHRRSVVIVANIWGLLLDIKIEDYEIMIISLVFSQRWLALCPHGIVYNLFYGKVRIIMVHSA